MISQNSQNAVEESIKAYNNFASKRTKQELMDNLSEIKSKVVIKNGQLTKIYKIGKYEIYHSLLGIDIFLKTPYILLLGIGGLLQIMISKHTGIKNIKKSIDVFEKSTQTKITIVENS